MFLIFGMITLALLSVTLAMLWTHERIANKKVTRHAKVEEYWYGTERRLHVRFKKTLEVEYSVEKQMRLKNSRIVDLSRGGMKLLLDEKLPKGAILDLKLHIPEKNRMIEIEASVVWTKDADDKDSSGRRFFHSGLKFIAIKEPSKTYLSHYLTHLESEGQ